MKWLANLFMRFSFFISKLFKRSKNPTSTQPVNEVKELGTYARRLNRNWEYKLDPVFGAINLIEHPQVAVTKNSGDCDDFASHLYHMARNMNVFLYTYFTKDIKSSHTILLIIENEIVHIFNWGNYQTVDNLKSLHSYCEKYSESKLIVDNWAKYDYDKEEFKKVNPPIT